MGLALAELGSLGRNERQPLKTLFLAFVVFPCAILAESLPDGIALTITLEKAVGGSLDIKSNERATVVLTFSNRTDAPIRFRIHDYDPYHKKLPYPVECAVRITDSDGGLHPIAKLNGEWWSQFKCWSTLFLEDDERNYRTLKPKEDMVYEVALADVLKVPGGGEPERWPFDHLKGFRPGSYLLKVRYGAVVSDAFIIRVEERGGESSTRALQPTRDDAFSSASRLTRLDPAWLSSSRSADRSVVLCPTQ